MNTLWKHDTLPLASLRREMDRLFEDILGKGNGGSLFAPLMDVRETDDALVIEAELPGMKPQEIQVQIVENVLSIRGERKHQKDERTKTFHRTERAWGRFEREFALPPTVDPEKLEAAYSDGVLRITVPKKAGAKAKTVTVKVTES